MALVQLDRDVGQAGLDEIHAVERRRQVFGSERHELAWIECGVTGSYRGHCQLAGRHPDTDPVDTNFQRLIWCECRGKDQRNGFERRPGHVQAAVSITVHVHRLNLNGNVRRAADQVQQVEVGQRAGDLKQLAR